MRPIDRLSNWYTSWIGEAEDGDRSVRWNALAACAVLVLTLGLMQIFG